MEYRNRITPKKAPALLPKRTEQSAQKSLRTALQDVLPTYQAYVKEIMPILQNALTDGDKEASDVMDKLNKLHDAIRSGLTYAQLVEPRGIENRDTLNELMEFKRTIKMASTKIHRLLRSGATYLQESDKERLDVLASMVAQHAPQVKKHTRDFHAAGLYRWN